MEARPGITDAVDVELKDEESLLASVDGDPSASTAKSCSRRSFGATRNTSTGERHGGCPDSVEDSGRAAGARARTAFQARIGRREAGRRTRPKSLNAG